MTTQLTDDQTERLYRCVKAFNRIAQAVTETSSDRLLDRNIRQRKMTIKDASEIAGIFGPILNDLCQELTSPHEAKQAQGEAAAFDVRSILLAVVPGKDGMGHEVYAKSVDDVVDHLTRMAEAIEELQARPQQGEGALGWTACADRLPEIPEGAPCSDFVLAGYWYTDPHLADSSRWKSRFIFGEGRVFEDRGHLLWDCRIGGIPTHWMPVNPPAIAAQKGAADA